VIGVPMLLRDLGIAGLAQGLYQRVIGGSETFTGSNNEHGARCDLGREIIEIQCGLMVVDLARQRFAARPGQRRNVVVLLQPLRLVRNGGGSGADVAE